MTSITAVIVTWNSGSTIDRCLDSCVGLDVTVVDNASIDDTVERVRRRKDVYLIANSTNRGFAAAANQGIARSSGEYILLLNPDVELLERVTPLVDACNEIGVCMASGCLVDGSGVPQTGFIMRRLPTPATLSFETLGLNRLFPANPVNRRYRCLDLDPESQADVEQPPGALLLFRRQTWGEVGGFDENFSPIWFEDVDFCKRVLERGAIRYVPNVRARHQGGASLMRLDWSSRETIWYGSLLRYASKHYSGLAFRAVCGAVVLGCCIRSFTGIFSRRSLTPLCTYAKIAAKSVNYIVTGRMQKPASTGVFEQANTARTITSSTK
jgi:GT2 family glycosyltransferase